MSTFLTLVLDTTPSGSSFARGRRISQADIRINQSCLSYHPLEITA